MVDSKRENDTEGTDIKRNVVVVGRSERKHARVDVYSWVTGQDKLPHKIGFFNGLPIVEKVNDEVLLLTESETEYYQSIINKKKAEV